MQQHKRATYVRKLDEMKLPNSDVSGGRSVMNLPGRVPSSVENVMHCSVVQEQHGINVNLWGGPSLASLRRQRHHRGGQRQRGRQKSEKGKSTPEAARLG